MDVYSNVAEADALSECFSIAICIYITAFLTIRPVWAQISNFSSSKIMLLPESYPWYEEYCEKLSFLLEQGTHEFLRHYLACKLIEDFTLLFSPLSL